MKSTSGIAGVRELDAALGALPKGLGKGVLRRVLLKRAEPIADGYRQGVDVETGNLRDTIGVGTRLTKRQARQAKREGKSYVEVYAGAGDDPAAHLEEFGSRNNAPNGALRRSWDTNGPRALEGLGEDLWAETEKTAQRHARRSAKAGA